jgi:hypothetical protein
MQGDCLFIASATLGRFSQIKKQSRASFVEKMKLFSSGSQQKASMQRDLSLCINFKLFEE